MEIRDVGKVLVFMVAPPQSPKAMSLWRFVIGGLVMLAIIALLIAWGYGQRFGVHGFALETDVTAASEKSAIAIKKVTDTLDDHSSQFKEIRTASIENSIIAAKQQQCQATKKIFFTDRIRELTDQYYALTGRLPSIPNCEDTQ